METTAHWGLSELQQLTLLSCGEKQKEQAHKKRNYPDWSQLTQLIKLIYPWVKAGFVQEITLYLWVKTDSFGSFSALPLAVPVIKKSIGLKLLIKHLDFC